MAVGNNDAEKRISVMTISLPEHGILVLLGISCMLLVRETFVLVTTVSNAQNTYYDERYWYSLLVVPEVVAVLLYTSPGLVPSRAQLT